MPHHYGDEEFEYTAIRSDCALFDVSPIRKIRIQGVGANNFLDRLLTRPVGKLPAMRATYIIFCDEDGNLKDDAVLYKFDDEDYLMMPSDIDHSPYFESLCERLGLGWLVNLAGTEFVGRAALIEQERSRYDIGTAQPDPRADG